MKKILVTGATGFIGRSLITFLQQQQCAIRVLIRDKRQAVYFDDGIEIYHGDLMKKESLLHLCQDIDIVFHLGGYAHARHNKTAAKLHHQINYKGTAHLLEESHRAKVNAFIYFSSVKAVADSPNEINESWQHWPISPYGIAKRQAEERVLIEKDHMHVCILRPALVYGPSLKGNLANMLKMIDYGLFPPFPKIENRRSMIGIDDLCQAAWLAANHTIASGKTYFVTDGHTYSTYDIYADLLSALEKKLPNWHIPISCLKSFEIVSNILHKLTINRFPSGTEIMSKLFGSAFYSSTLIETELGFKPKDRFHNILPNIIKCYRKKEFS